MHIWQKRPLNEGSLVHLKLTHPLKLLVFVVKLYRYENIYKKNIQKALVFVWIWSFSKGLNFS